MAETQTATETASKVTFGDLKKAVLAFKVSVAEIGNFDKDKDGDGLGAPFAELKEFAAYDALIALADIIADTSDRGIPLEVKLQKAQDDQAAHYAAVQVKDGKPQFTPEWVTKNEELTARVNSLKGQIKRRDADLKKKANEKAAAEKAALEAKNAPAPEKKDAKA